MKICKTCNKGKDFSEYYISYQGAKGPVYSVYCKECSKKLSTKWGRANKRSRWASQIKHEYGITIEQYEELLEKQNHSCAICFRHKSLFKKKLHIDHCHSTGKIRGVLCANCNSAIGKLKDNTNILRNAITYLEKEND